MDLLRFLHEKSKHYRPKSANPISPKPPNMTGSSKQDVYQYQSRLISTTEQYSTTLIRVLHIFPGTGDSPIRCSLEVRDLNAEGIHEALSYVWGTGKAVECIFIDDAPFHVTLNLYNILTYLRPCHSTRTIWIDAICINQSDPEEKAEQVRLMKDIYSKAKTYIWLSGRTLYEQPDMNPQPIASYPSDICAHLPLNFMGNTIDQYDLRGMLDELCKLTLGDDLDDKSWALVTMLVHCVNVVLSHDWWKRIWTVQEAALPREHPQILLQAHGFSFGSNRSTARFLALSWRYQFAFFRRMHRPTLLQSLRSAKEDREDIPDAPDRSLQYLLCKTDTYRATDPRDKIFALQSLLCSPLGALICVDYNDSYEAVFRRASARCLNSVLGKRERYMTKKFKLLIETQPRDAKAPLTPSWVQDFAYSSSNSGRDDYRDTQELDEGLFSEFIRRPLYEISRRKSGICFATPKVLFCSGVHLDVIHKTHYIAEPSGSDPVERLNELWMRMNIHLDQSSEGLIWQREVQEVKHEPTSSIASLFREALEVMRNPPRDQTILQSIKQIEAVFGYFYLGVRESPKPTNERTFGFADTVSKQIAGETYFTTEKGFKGFVTCPVQSGDILGLLHMCPVYYVFREVEYEADESPSVQKYRIVARATVCGSERKLKKRFKSLDSQVFQIV
ncbi:heterokaryon incompatibility protein-domain-containing protein [Rostrohypoxylon terebratum]|nr:heterokaryon incompatibility protein-domain-containing protein [Rostrohypoxylon terebratum]